MCRFRMLERQVIQAIFYGSVLAGAVLNTAGTSSSKRFASLDALRRRFEVPSVGIVGRWIAVFHFGRALGRFYQGRYEEAARLLEKVRKLDPSEATQAQFNSVLGRSYLALGNSGRARELLSRAYQCVVEAEQRNERPLEDAEWVATLKAYSNALHKTGRPDQARVIAQEVERQSQQRSASAAK